MLRIAIATLLVTVASIALLDEPVAHWIATYEMHPAIWNRGIGWLEYAIGIEPWKWLGICVLVAGSIASLTVPRMRSQAPAWLLITFTHLVSRNLTSWIKFGTGRLRPSEWLARAKGSAAGEAASAAARDQESWFRDGGFSFPSGHVVLFASILVPLAVVYPRTRPLLAIVAFAMIARMMVNAHFLSDVVGGLALVATVTWLVRRALPSRIRPASPR